MSTHLSKKYLAAFMATPLLMLPYSAFASKNFGGDGDGLILLIILPLAYIVINFVIAIINIWLQNVWLRAISIIMALPLLALTAMSMFYVPQVGMVSLFVLLLLGIIIFSSYEKRTAA